MSIFVLASPSSAAPSSNSSDSAVVYEFNPTTKNAVVRRAKPSLIKAIGEILKAACIGKCVVVASGYTYLVGSEVVYDVWNGRALTRNIFRRAWNNFSFERTAQICANILYVTERVRSMSEEDPHAV